MRSTTSFGAADVDLGDGSCVELDTETHDATTNNNDVVKSWMDLDMAPPATAAIATALRARYGPPMSFFTSLKDRAVISISALMCCLCA